MSRPRWLVFRRREQRDLTREMQSHVDERVDALIDTGVDPLEARRRARAEFGSLPLQVERSREVWTGRWLDTIRQDALYALRALLRQPGFTVSAIGILALAMGMVMVLVTAVNATLLRPWPVPDPESLVLIRPNPLPGQQYGTLSSREFRHIRAQTETFRHFAAWLSGGSNLRAGNAVAFAGTRYVTSNYFDAMTLAPARGRLFEPADEDYLQPRAVIVLSSRLAGRLFGLDADPIGRTTQVDGKPFLVIGIVSSTSTRFGVDAWMPLPSIGIVQDSRPFDDAESSFASGIFGRLAAGVDATRAKAELDTIGRQFRQSAGKTSAGFTLRDTRAISADLSEIRQQVAVLGALFGGLGMVLLLACANVGNLILARGLTRRRETAIRMSLGATGWRMMRQFVTESVVMTGSAGAIGAGIGYAIPIGLLRAFPGQLEMDAARFTPDAVTFAATVALVSVATAVAGLTPALRLSRVNLAERASNRHGHDRGAGRLRTAFLAAQIALSMTLLVTAGLLSRAALKVLSYDPGFAIHEVQQLRFHIPGAARARSLAFMRALDDALHQKALAQHAFSEFNAISGAFRNSTATSVGNGNPISREVIVRNVTSTYFSTLGMPFVAGRAPNASSSSEVVLNESAARVLWPDGKPLGQRVATKGRPPMGGEFTVVGVTADVPVRTLSRIDLVMYAPFEPDGVLLLRSQSPTHLQQITSLATSLEPKVRVSSARLADDLRASSREVAMGGYVAWTLGALALVLATIGAFGVFAYVVEERRREIGVRLALGASAAAVIRSIVGATRWPIGCGLAAGLVLAIIAARLLRATLYGVSPVDPITYGGVALILTMAAVVATWIPARRATRIDPAVTLRGE